MHGWVIHTLTGVKHTMDLMKNLISLCSLEDVGYKFRSEGGVIKVSKGVVNLIKVKRLHTLYFFSRPHHYRVVLITSSTSNSKNTKLLHMRLEHISKYGMEILS